MENDDLILDPTPEPTAEPDAAAPELTPEPEAVIEPEPVEEPEVIQGANPDAYYDVIYTAVNDALVAQTVTDGQSISSSALEYFKGILNNQSPFTDYVIYVGEPYQYWWGNNQQTAYEYCMAYGDLDLNGITFTGQADIVTMRISGENSVSFVNDQNVSITAPMYYSRSNLGEYSGVVKQDYVSFGVLCALVLGGVVWFVKSLLSPKS